MSKIFSGINKRDGAISKCRAKDPDNCPYHVPGSHALRDQQEITNNNENVYLKKQQPKKLSKARIKTNANSASTEKINKLTNIMGNRLDESKKNLIINDEAPSKVDFRIDPNTSKYYVDLEYSGTGEDPDDEAIEGLKDEVMDGLGDGINIMDRPDYKPFDPLTPENASKRHIRLAGEIRE